MVVGIAEQNEASSRCRRGDVVRARGGQRSEDGPVRRVGGDGAKQRDREPGRQVRSARREVNRQPVALRLDAGDVAGLAGHVRGGADDIAEEHLTGRRSFMRGSTLRSIVCLKVCAVSG